MLYLAASGVLGLDDVMNTSVDYVREQIEISETDVIQSTGSIKASETEKISGVFLLLE